MSGPWEPVRGTGLLQGPLYGFSVNPHTGFRGRHTDTGHQTPGWTQHGAPRVGPADRRPWGERASGHQRPRQGGRQLPPGPQGRSGVGTHFSRRRRAGRGRALALPCTKGQTCISGRGSVRHPQGTTASQTTERTRRVRRGSVGFGRFWFSCRLKNKVYSHVFKSQSPLHVAAQTPGKVKPLVTIFTRAAGWGRGTGRHGEHSLAR